MQFKLIKSCAQTRLDGVEHIAYITSQTGMRLFLEKEGINVFSRHHALVTLLVGQVNRLSWIAKPTDDVIPIDTANYNNATAC